MTGERPPHREGSAPDAGFDVGEVIARAVLGLDAPTRFPPPAERVRPSEVIPPPEPETPEPSAEQPTPGDASGWVDTPWASAPTVIDTGAVEEDSGETASPESPADVVETVEEAPVEVAPIVEEAPVEEAPEVIATWVRESPPEVLEEPATTQPGDSIGPPPPPMSQDGGRVRRLNRRRSEPVAPEAPPSLQRTIIEWIVTALIAGLIAVLVNQLLITPFRIPSPSMVSTLQEDERILVNRLSYRLHDVNRGDVIVFDRPGNLAAGPGEPEVLVKRVVALPGERVEGRGGRVLVNGEPLDEPYLDDGVSTEDFPAVNLPEGRVFVLGDNRRVSQDSRFFGPIPEDSVVGRAFARIWPAGRIGGI